VERGFGRIVREPADTRARVGALEPKAMTTDELILAACIWALPLAGGLTYVLCYRSRPDGMTR
jgi:hypothetical protein